MERDQKTAQAVQKRIELELAAFKKQHKALSKKTLLNLLFYQMLKINALERNNGKASDSVQLPQSQNIQNQDESL